MADKTASQPETEELVTASYTIPVEWKAWIKRKAQEQDLNESQVVRRLLRPHFETAEAKPDTRKARVA